MAITIETPQGEVEVFAAWSGGMLDAIIRAETQQDWINAAVSRELLFQEQQEDGSVTLRRGKGVDITEIGVHVLTPGTYDDQGNELTAPVVDPRYHVNIRLNGYALEKLNSDGTMPQWVETVVAWTTQGTPVAEKNAQEEARELYKVQLIDPATISSPSRIWQ